MKILHIFDDYGTPGERALAGEGSVPTVVYSIARHAAQEGHDVTILERGQDSEIEYLDGIRYVRIKAEKLPAPPYKLIKNPTGLIRLFSDSISMALKINNFLRKEDFDVIHVHFPFAASILVNMNRSLRRKMVYTAHIGQEEIRLSAIVKDKKSSPPYLLRLLSPDLYLMKRTSSVTVMHEDLANKLLQYGFKNDSVHVIPHGMDITIFDKIDNLRIKNVQENFISEGKITVLFAATVTPHKGVEYLAKAADILINKEKLNVRFILAGNTELNKEFVGGVKKYIDERCLSKDVIIAGLQPIEELKALYSSSDIFVYPLLGHGGVAISILEAMAAGLPIIATNIGGLPMQVREGYNGFLAKPANEKQLAERIRYLIENEEERVRMGENSRKLAREEFDWRKIAERYLKVYKEIAG